MDETFLGGRRTGRPGCRGVPSPRILAWVIHSLVDDRCLDRIHVIRMASEYRMDRPTGKKGGPSPRILALASQERLTFNRAATSFGVRTLSGSADGL
jgi:hypothetical protein